MNFSESRRGIFGQNLTILQCQAAVQLYLARGKVLGGSSSTNATLYMRGTREDYDAWGIPEWSSQRALHGFIKCEDNNNGK